jgi:hypothetical protein
MTFRISSVRKAATTAKPKDRLLPFGLRDTYRRLEQVNDALLINNYWEQRNYIAAINMQYAIKAIPVLPEEKIRVHFLYIDANLWPLWDGLYRACAADVQFEVKVIFLDAGQNKLAEKLPPDVAFLREKGISYTPYADYDPYVECPHLLIYQSPLDEVYQRFAKCKANFIKKRGIRPVSFCGPEYDAPEPEVHKTLYQQNVHMFAWRIVALRREIKEEFYRHCLPGGDAVLVVDDMGGGTIRDGLLKALHEERERLARACKNAALHDDLECLTRFTPEER